MTGKLAHDGNVQCIHKVPSQLHCVANSDPNLLTCTHNLRLGMPPIHFTLIHAHLCYSSHLQSQHWHCSSCPVLPSHGHCLCPEL